MGHLDAPSRNRVKVTCIRYFLHVLLRESYKSRTFLCIIVCVHIRQAILVNQSHLYILSCPHNKMCPVCFKSKYFGLHFMPVIMTSVELKIFAEKKWLRFFLGFFSLSFSSILRIVCSQWRKISSARCMFSIPGA